MTNRQMTLAGQEKTAWAGWRNMGKGVLRDYGRLLAEGRFEDIAAGVDKL